MQLVKFKDITINLDKKRKPLNGIAREKISEKKLYPYCGANNIIDYVDEYLFDEEILCIAEDGGKWGRNEECSYIMKGKCWINNHAHVVKTTDMVDIRYLMYWLNYKNLNPIITGAIVRKLTQRELNNIEIELPDKKEQLEIVSKLEKIRYIIEFRKKQIQEIDKIIKSKFVYMFQKGKYLKEKLGNLCDVRDGTHDSPKYLEKSEYKFITSKNIIGNKIDFQEIKYISKRDYDKINIRSKVNFGDILMPMIGTIGKPIIININDDEIDFAIKNVALIKFTEETKVTNIYIKSLFDSDYFENAIAQNKRGGTQKFIALSDIRNMEVEVPPIELQNKFANIVKQIEGKKSKIEASLEKMQEIWNALMERYFG